MILNDLIEQGYIFNLQTYTSKTTFSLNVFKGEMRKILNDINIDEITSVDKDIYNFKGISTFFLFNNDSLIIHKACSSNIEARNVSLNLVEKTKRLLSNYFSICSLDGEAPLNSNIIKLVFINSMDEIKEFLVININDKNEINAKIKFSSFLEALVSHKEEGIYLQNTNLRKNLIAILPYKDKEKGVNAYCEELYEELVSTGYKVVLDRSEENNFEKKNRLIKEGITFFMEVGPKEIEKDEIRFSSCIKKEFKLILKEKIFKVIEREKETYNNNLLNKSKIKVLNIQKEGTSICSTCLKNEKIKFILFPYSQVNLAKKCAFCGKEAIKKII